MEISINRFLLVAVRSDGLSLLGLVTSARRLRVRRACEVLLQALNKSPTYHLIRSATVRILFNEDNSTFIQSPSRGLRHFLAHVKFRTFSKTPVDLWSHHWVNPLTVVVPVNDPHQFLDILADVEGPLSKSSVSYNHYPLAEPNVVYISTRFAPDSLLGRQP